MIRTVYVGTRPDGRFAALKEDGQLVEYLLDAKQAAQLPTGAIVLGRVLRTVKGMNAAFLDIGEEKNGFLPLTEKNLPDQTARFQDGEAVIVQIQREAHARKGAFLTRDISLQGTYWVYMPRSATIGVSEKIRNEDKRKALRSVAESCAQHRFGLVARTASATATEEALRTECDQLHRAWQQLQSEAATAHVPSVLAGQQDAVAVYMRDLCAVGVETVALQPDMDLPVPEGTAVRPMTAFEASALTAEVDKALKHQVWMDSGASLVIDECEALTVIDVNTAKFTGKAGAGQTMLQTNIEACDAICRQLRLRNIGGIIVIDFIDLKNDNERAQVLDALRKAMKRDRQKSIIHDYTALGLVEMTRKRTSKSLREIMKLARNQTNKGEQHG